MKRDTLESATPTARASSEIVIDCGASGVARMNSPSWRSAGLRYGSFAEIC